MTTESRRAWKALFGVALVLFVLLVVATAYGLAEVPDAAGGY